MSTDSQPLNSNERVAKIVVSKLKDHELISKDETVVEKKIANGSIRENDWKVLFETKLRELQKEKTIETK